MSSILIVYNYILHYRKPLFNRLTSRYNITVLHSGEKTVSAEDFYKEIITDVKKIGPFYLQRGVLSEALSKKYDVVIFLFDVRWLTTLVVFLLGYKRKKFILWGAWLTSKWFANMSRLFLTKKAYSNIYYTYRSMNDFVSLGANPDNLYVANNTFDVGQRIKSYESSEKNTILSVGSLDPRKQNDVLLTAFARIIKSTPSSTKLVFVGDGKDEEKLKKLTKEFGIENHVEFVGRINDPLSLREYYSKALCSVSFGQAGLSVLQSLGFGVPFVTKVNAITGGEIVNVKHMGNGILCEDSLDSLQTWLLKLMNEPILARKLGAAAYEYYTNYCTIENMAQGFIDSIERTRKSVVDITTASPDCSKTRID
jgi:glycosyltransferase involved in cell wall biosynthesis